uniref:Similarity n=1 Tax=Microcystis aeruginosa (strain PCC 7806) TaxID=267872 RepID=A8YCR6_MICA7|nr:unnamed protein product [Microcystis aeruginosa PCC 7806]
MIRNAVSNSVPGESRLSWVWWVKCILRYIPPSGGMERTTKTQRLIDRIVS